MAKKVPDFAKVYKRIKKLKKGDWVTYNVVDETGFYNVDGEVIKVNKDGTVDVQTAMKIDRRVEPKMVAFGELYPAGVIHIRAKSKKRLKKVV